MSKRILIIDDEPALARGLAFRLKSNGYTTTCAHTGASGLEAARQECPDAILLDSHLPDAQGLDVFVALREDASTAEVPVIMMSGNDREEVRATQLGVSAFLLKPFQTDTLLATVSACLKAERAVLQT